MDIAAQLEQFGCAAAGQVAARELALSTAPQLRSLIEANAETGAPFIALDRVLSTPAAFAIVRPVVEAIARSDAMRALHRALGGDIAVLGNQSILRAVSGGVTAVPWHQDVNFTGAKHRVVNCWTALADCGADLPGLEVLRHRFNHSIHEQRREVSGAKRVGSSDPYAEHYLGASLAEILGDDAPTSSLGPRLSAGEALLFDQFCLHRTQPIPAQAPRVSLELRMAALSDILAANDHQDGRFRSFDLLVISAGATRSHLYRLQGMSELRGPNSAAAADSAA